jgi:hypothetical protein
MRLRAYPEIGQRIKLSQGSERTEPLAQTALVEPPSSLRAKRSNPGNVARTRDSWIATSAFGLLAMTNSSRAACANDPRAY